MRLILLLISSYILRTNSCSDGTKIQIREKKLPNALKAEYKSRSLEHIVVTARPWLLVNNTECLKSVKLRVKTEEKSWIQLENLTEDHEWTIDAAPCETYYFQLDLEGKTKGDSHQVDLHFGPATEQQRARYHLRVDSQVSFEFPARLSWSTAKCVKEYGIKLVLEDEEEKGAIIKKTVTPDQGFDGNYVDLENLEACKYYMPSISVTDIYNNTELMELDDFDFFSGPNQTEVSLIDVNISVEGNDVTVNWEVSTAAFCLENEKFLVKLCYDDDMTKSCTINEIVPRKSNYNYNYKVTFYELENCTHYTIQVTLLLVENNYTLEVGQKKNITTQNCELDDDEIIIKTGVKEQKISSSDNKHKNLTDIPKVELSGSKPVGDQANYTQTTKSFTEFFEDRNATSNATWEAPKVATKSSKAAPNNTGVTVLWVLCGLALFAMLVVMVVVAFNITPTKIREHLNKGNEHDIIYIKNPEI